MAPIPRLVPLLPWPAPATPEGQAFFRTADEIAEAFRAKGAHKTLMLAMLGAAEVNSRLNGCLWLSFEGEDGHLSVEEQVDKAWSEMETGGVFRLVAAATHAQDAGQAVGDYFMRDLNGDVYGRAAARWETDWQFSGW